MFAIRRRSFLQAAVSGALAGVAGCGGCSKPAPEPGAEEERKPARGDRPRVGRFGLLVGVTKYPQGLAEKKGRLGDLAGPGNDVALLRRVLVERFGFPADNIVALTEDAGGANRPTRAHIEREFKGLPAKARAGDRVVILLAGHGSQQPEKDPPDPHFPEDDGLDEVFLPADVRPWDPATRTLPNAIIDDEIRLWTDAITARGASVFLIADCCHSGTILRAERQPGDEVLRGIPPEELIPRAALEAARKKAAGRARTRGGVEQSPLKFARQNSIVALYAAQPEEPTPEAWFPSYDAPDRKMQGILTYAVCEILSQAVTPLTYRELSQRLPAHYRSWDRTFKVPLPTPFAEGTDLDREVLGAARRPGRSVLTLKAEEDRPMTVTGGTLHGLRPGSVLAVYPPPGEGEKLLGHVRVTASKVFESKVTPCAHPGKPLRKDLPDGGRVEPVVRVHDLHDLRVAVGDVPADQRALLERVVRETVKEPGSLVRFVKDPRKANWVVRADGEDLVLTPSRTTPRLTLKRDDLEADLGRRLRDVARAVSLLAVACSAAEAPAGGKVQVELVLEKRKSEADRKGSRLSDAERAGLKTPQYVGTRIFNKGKMKVDVTLLYVDSNYVISDVFPFQDSNEDNRILPGRSFNFPRASKVTDRTVGLEHFVLIAVEARQEERTSFSYLATTQRDPGDHPARKIALGQLFDHALFRHGTRRSSDSSGGDFQIQVLSWRVLPGDRK